MRRISAQLGACRSLVNGGAELRVSIAEQQLGYQLTVLEFPD
jgi:hypothetical protein